MSTLTEDQRWKDTKFLVQATNTEKFFLWQQHSKESLWPNPNLGLVDWENDCGGLWEQIGTVDRRPVNLCVWWAKINGVLIAFYECISQIADWRLIEEWVDKNAKDIPHCNADNFHQCLAFCTWSRLSLIHHQ